MLIGRTMDYDQLDQQIYYGGAESALWWALGRSDDVYPSRTIACEAEEPSKAEEPPKAENASEA
jgi:hypothetical protein